MRRMRYSKHEHMDASTSGGAAFFRGGPSEEGPPPVVIPSTAIKTNHIDHQHHAPPYFVPCLCNAASSSFMSLPAFCISCIIGASVFGISAMTDCITIGNFVTTALPVGLS